MSLRARILGCGTSSGVPRIGNDWGKCDPANVKNRRTRASILVESDTTRILVDTSPDMREQLLAAHVVAIDAILWTHDHADHCHGLDDIRQIAQHRRSPVPGYAFVETLSQLRHRFAYAFDGRDGYPPVIYGHELPERMAVGDIGIERVAQPHGSIWSAGFRFEQNGKSIGYSTDLHEFTPEMIALFSGLDHWIVDALREKPHPTHAHLDLTLDAIALTQPRHAWLTHMDHSMDYDSLCTMLPENIRPAHDGLVVIA